MTAIDRIRADVLSFFGRGTHRPIHRVAIKTDTNGTKHCCALYGLSVTHNDTSRNFYEMMADHYGLSHNQTLSIIEGWDDKRSRPDEDPDYRELGRSLAAHFNLR